MREAGKGRVPGRWGFSKGEKGKKLEEIRQHRLILHNRKRAEVARKVKKKKEAETANTRQMRREDGPSFGFVPGVSLYVPFFPFYS